MPTPSIRVLFTALIQSRFHLSVGSYEGTRGQVHEIHALGGGVSFSLACALLQSAIPQGMSN